MGRWVRWIVWAAALVALAFLGDAARGHDHERPELNAWFSSLKSGKGMCCDGGEAVHLTDVDWQLKDGHYRVRIPVSPEAYEAARHGAEVETEWADVPDDAIVTEPNKEGTAMVWPIYGYLGKSVRCFMPGTMG